MVVELHGGPIGGESVTGQMICVGALERQIWAAKGYAVLAPDYRTSGVYGWDQILAGREKQNFMEMDFADIDSGVNAMVKAGVADPTASSSAGTATARSRPNGSSRTRIATRPPSPTRASPTGTARTATCTASAATPR